MPTWPTMRTAASDAAAVMAVLTQTKLNRRKPRPVHTIGHIPPALSENNSTSRGLGLTCEPVWRRSKWNRLDWLNILTCPATTESRWTAVGPWRLRAARRLAATERRCMCASAARRMHRGTSKSRSCSRRASAAPPLRLRQMDPYVDPRYGTALIVLIFPQ
jgi:hypothetical protein